ncbi:sigma-70 family RNA polymerase sigma factor [Chitinimonas sp. BJB300]|uniref:sigma-70 family RNA polymerase sigma factor n=1 Tax=Chitinimonas sp. BJB300 TaxID=1559339 RepID=UPI000C0F6D2E|nr:sigma-70 family RNA polymerase sigma factor [Chitinimonas sp. BJB300]PHV12741.1 RNA polymerase subunit sigma [Chitinimonas sp. BJB300]TSJ90920.1 sigma-70 family RNA polymerase sigma factor [Chitinimonas sp. BJB300]
MTLPDDQQLAEFRDYLLRYALYRLRDEAAAEEAVQDTLLAALQAKSGFGAQSSVKTWLTGILKHKIIDAQRKLCREPLQIDERVDSDGDVSDFDGLFDKTGHWGSDGPRTWANPDASLEQQDFWRMYEKCNERLTKRTALVFAMRESLGYEIEEICQNLEITATNCSVLLYRARMSLRLCLEKNWFGERS